LNTIYENKTQEAKWMSDKTKGYLQVLTISLINLIILTGTINIFFPLRTINVAVYMGILGFIGTIIGGIITFYGVKLTLLHKEREVFLKSISLVMYSLEDLIENLGHYITTFSLINGSNNMTNEFRRQKNIEILDKFCEEFDQQKQNIRENIDYDSTKVLFLHIKFLRSKVLILKLKNINDINESEIFQAIENCKDVLKSTFDLKTYYENKHKNYKKFKL
jgi:hypothetical protein